MQSLTSKTKPRHSWQFKAIGTSWSIDTTEPLGNTADSITNIITVFDQVYSRFRDDSLVAEIAKKTGTYMFPSTDELFITFYRNLYDATKGAVSPMVGALLEDAGYDKNYSMQSGVVTKAPEWSRVMSWQQTQVITTQPWMLDFGAAGKGYLVDLVCYALDRAGYTQYVVDASGDIRIKGLSEIIGLENPYDSTSVIGSVPLQQGSLCASATNRRAWGEWNHVIDPRNGRPVHDIVATWVISPTAMVADGVATALFFVPASTLEQWNFEYVRLYHDGSIERSPGFVGELYI